MDVQTVINDDLIKTLLEETNKLLNNPDVPALRIAIKQAQLSALAVQLRARAGEYYLEHETNKDENYKLYRYYTAMADSLDGTNGFIAALNRVMKSGGE